jgi:hypothetical protein
MPCAECESLQSWYREKMFAYVRADYRREVAAALKPEEFAAANRQAEEAERDYLNAQAAFLLHARSAHVKDSES